jgi:2-polyprenyl-3-methyl-5-hydroxy-6-metoxy-1,4-benzoquinol methylase
MTVQPSEIFAEKACYLCNSSSIAMSNNRRSVTFHKTHKYYRCNECKSYSLFPKLENHELEELYSIKYIGDVNPEFNVNEEVAGSRFSHLRESLEKIENSKSKSFLDYGCGGTAEAIILAANLGFKAFGVEVEAGTRREAQLISDCQVFSPEEVLASGLQFDFIFLGDVLEHLCEPLEVLVQVQTLLSPTGLLIIQGPLEGAATISNALLSVKARFLSKYPSTFPPYHVSLATKDSIMKALKISELTIKKLVITEPVWPAPKFGSRSTFVSAAALIFSLAKILDIAFSKVVMHYGTRFFLVATKQ